MNINYFKIILSAVAFVCAIGYGIANVSDNSKDVFMNGKLSEKHMALKFDCEKCHTPWLGVSESKCVECHKDSKHYDMQKTGKVAIKEHERLRCPDCHKDHQGVGVDIKRVEDKACVACHNTEMHKKMNAVKFPIKIKNDALFNHNYHFSEDLFDGDDCRRCHIDSFGKGEFVMIDNIVINVCSSCHEINEEEHTAPVKDKLGCEPCHFKSEHDEMKKMVLKPKLFIYSHKKHSSTKCTLCHFISIEEKGQISKHSDNKNECFACHKENAGASNCIVCHYYHA